MKKPSSNIKIDWAGTKKIRSAMKRQNFIKITLNIDADSLSALKSESVKTGVPYQRIHNSVLKESLTERKQTTDRLTRIEKEISALKRRIAA